jgi:hypothetical protein
MYNNTTGLSNIAIGTSSVYNWTIGNSNIAIGSAGVAGEDKTIRIGSIQTRAYLAGVVNVATGQNAVPVIIDQNGQLGTLLSSRRYKEDVEDMGDESARLLKLRPVTFRYQQPYADGSKPIDYGLIAEEVAEIYPDLVVRGAGGEIETVQYQKLTPMLLNELKKQDELIRALQKRVAAIETSSRGSGVDVQE